MLRGRSVMVRAGRGALMVCSARVVRVEGGCVLSVDVPSPGKSSRECK